MSVDPGPTLVADSDPFIGKFVGSYRVRRRLGSGGMGAVYELVHEGIGKRLALKLLHPHYAARPDIVSRFFAEARAVNLVGHPNIVDIIDFAQLPDGRAYLTMEYLDGDSLSGLLERQKFLAPDEVAAIVLPLCAALGAAHKAGIIHRDLKPENIHLVRRHDNPRTVKVLDFGIAKLTVEGAPAAYKTKTGVVMGTPEYMSPEQATGQTVDHRTDIYAVGIIIYELLTGRAPFAGEIGELILKHLHETPVPPSGVRAGVPPAWDAVVARAMAKDRADRFQSMDELAAAVRAAAAGQVVRVPTTQKQRRRQILVLLGVIAAVGVAVNIAFFAAGGKKTPAPPVVAAPPDAAPRPRPIDAAPAEARKVILQLMISPRTAKARIWIDGRQQEAIVELAQSRTTPVHVRVEADGYRAFEADVIPATDIALPVTLERR
jgi:hypothetical protein